ncbi:hypothetical protein [Desulfosporosinus sp. BICA1-9]|uniref:hypothetical protein n=1 Tax=Desulfosporosinus sp. BICA1-9 TaxID=1531958 RepID=UPI00054BB7D8|nr:hypothetical protein [Desulfosporosinus sp. BICA1-9]KJS47015.1 MAG: hypothetical protein VR66_22170 [Peptococcaceae bacterium BRH_c23]KJS87850.1 MAG: hypothetical protein JL57_13295 [Desulfosporosinus sp. BICA1-9]
MEFSISELKVLKQQFAAASSIGIFSGIDNNNSTESLNSLEKRGVLQNGVLSKEAKELLDIAANPDLSCRFILQESSILVEKYTYRKGADLVLVENAGGVLRISKGSDLDKIMMNIGNFIGLTSFKRADFEIALSKDEIYVLLSMFDIYREKTMLSYCQQQSEAGATFAEIRSHLDMPNETGLVAMIQANYKWEIPSLETTKALIYRLVAKNVVASNKNFTLTEEYAVFGSNFLAYQLITTVELLQMLKDGQTALSGILYISAGLKDNLLFIMGGDEIEISTVSSSYALKIFEGLLKCPSIV